MTSNNTVRLGSIGLGWWGSELARAASRTGLAEVVACYARRPEGREAFAAEHGCRPVATLEELLESDEVEGVLIATSHESHRELIEAAAASGTHVFVEKPLTTNYADGLAAVEAAEDAGILLQVGHQRRLTPGNRRMKEMIEAGELGDIEIVTGVQHVPNGFKMPDEAWRWNPDQSPLGSMTSLGVHKIETFQHLAGPIRSVGTMTRPGRFKAIDEATVLNFEFESGALGSLATSFYSAHISEVTVYGMNATAYSTSDGRMLHVQIRGEHERNEVPLAEVDTVAEQLAIFARAARGEGVVEVDGRVGLSVIAVLEAAVRSAEAGGVVEVAEVTA